MVVVKIDPNNPIKKVMAWLWLLVCLLSLLFVAVATHAVWHWSASLQPARIITVSGEGRAVLVPDIATITLSVVSEGGDVSALQKDNNIKINNAIGFLKDLGIDEKDIKTSNYNLSPMYRYDEKLKKSLINGYNLTQTITVKVRDLDRVADILGGLPALGINQISGPNFAIDDVDKFTAEARKKAFQKAWQRARELAEMNGVGLGRVVTFNEDNSGITPMPYFAKDMAMGGNAGGVRPDIEVGSEDVKVRVSVTFEIR